MVDAFSELTHVRRGFLGGAALWWLLIRDLVATMIQEWKAELMSTSTLRTLAPRVAGLSAFLGALTWFVVFLGPQWGFSDQAYRPVAILLGAILLTIGLAARAVIEWAGWRPLRRLGFGALLLSFVLLGVQAPIYEDVVFLKEGVSFDTAQDAPVRGIGVYILPLAVAALVMAWGWAQTRVRLLALLVGMALLALAVALLFPPQARWFDIWDFVFRYAYLLAALVIAARSGYQLIGGPIIRLEWPEASQAPAA
jgi:hypothetical protein